MEPRQILDLVFKIFGSRLDGHAGGKQKIHGLTLRLLRVTLGNRICKTVSNRKKLNKIEQT